MMSSENRSHFSASCSGGGNFSPPRRKADLTGHFTAKSHGIDLSGQRARRIIPRDFRDFDLVLAMDRDNLAAL
jgi:protein-tyrosine phosphatase